MMPTAASRRAMCSGRSRHFAYLDTSNATLRSPRFAKLDPATPRGDVDQSGALSLKGCHSKAQPARMRDDGLFLHPGPNGIPKLCTASCNSLESPRSKAAPKCSQGCSLSKAMCLVKNPPRLNSLSNLDFVASGDADSGFADLYCYCCVHFHVGE